MTLLVRNEVNFSRNSEEGVNRKAIQDRGVKIRKFLVVRSESGLAASVTAIT